MYLPKEANLVLDRCGINEVDLKSDGEPAIVDVKRAMKEMRKERTVLQQSPVEDHQANGEAENAIRQVVNKFRTIKMSTEKLSLIHI